MNMAENKSSFFDEIKMQEEKVVGHPRTNHTYLNVSIKQMSIYAVNPVRLVYVYIFAMCCSTHCSIRLVFLDIKTK